VKTVCPDGPPRTRFLRPEGPTVRQTDSAVVLTMRILSPCPLDSLELASTPWWQGNTPIRNPHRIRSTWTTRSASTRKLAKFPFPRATPSEAAIVPRSSSPPDPRGPSVDPMDLRGIVVLGLLTGVVALFRPLPGFGRFQRARHPGASNPTCSCHIRHDREVRRGPGAERKSWPTGEGHSARPKDRHAPECASSLECDPQRTRIGAGRTSALAIARAGLRGTVLVATGRGPVSIEIVFEDNGPDIDDGTLKLMFDASSPSCATATDWTRRSLELRIASCGCRAPFRGTSHRRRDPSPRTPTVQSASGPRANSLLK
jgi:hypothetical protein